MGTTNVNGGKLPQNNKDFRIPNKQDIQQGNGLKIASKFQVGTPTPRGRSWGEMTLWERCVWGVAASAFIGTSHARSMESGSREGNNVSNEMQPVAEIPPHLLKNEGSWNSGELTNVEYLTSKELQFGMVPESQSRETLGSSQKSSESSITPFRLGEAVEPDKLAWRTLSLRQGEHIRVGNKIQYSDLNHRSGNKIQYSPSFQNHLSQSMQASQRNIDKWQHKALQSIRKMTDSLELDPLGEESTTRLKKLASTIKNANNGLADVSEFKKYQTGPHLNTAEAQATAKVDKSQIDISRRLRRIVDLYQQYQGWVAADIKDPVPELKNQMRELGRQINDVQQDIHTLKAQSGEDSEQMEEARNKLQQLREQLDYVRDEYTIETNDNSLHGIKRNLKEEKGKVQEQLDQMKQFSHMTKPSLSQQKQDRSLLKDMVNRIIKLWA